MKQLSAEELNRPNLQEYQQLRKVPVIVILDNVRSGLNVGAIFRTCDAFSIEAIYLCGITVQPPHTEIMKTALGATESVAWKYFENADLACKAIKEKGYSIIAVEQTDASKSLGDIDINAKLPFALVFGNEMRGIAPEVLLQCDSSIEIPQAGIKHSLNVATSAGIVLWECYRQFNYR
ncbi:MAG TPA: RNA methyltransferase [Saprospiraceae bacterium]|nr:RNA methyltransferase [Saprospiraceae bacterium]